jgi:soluble cytochrome b562
MTDYQREVTTGFRSAWINAMQANDRAQARDIESAVREWNDGAKGTALEIKNFRPGSIKALREAQRPAGERALKSAPRAARQDLEKLSTLLAY